MKKYVLVGLLSAFALIFSASQVKAQVSFMSFGQIGDTTFTSFDIKAVTLTSGSPTYTLRIWSDMIPEVDSTVAINNFGGTTTIIHFDIPVQWQYDNAIIYAQTTQGSNHVNTQTQIQVRVPLTPLLGEFTADTVRQETSFFANLNANIYNYDRLGGQARWRVYNVSNQVVLDSTMAYDEAQGPVWTAPVPMPLTVDMTSWPVGSYYATLEASSMYLSSGESDSIVFTRPAIDTTDTTTTVVEIKQLEAKAFPNPFVEQLTVEIPQGNTQIAVYNMVGKLMSSVTVPQPGKHVLDTSEYPKGVYLVSIAKGSTTKTFKLSK
jgi:hypothetical protein